MPLILLRLAPYLIGLLVLFAGYEWLNRGWCNKACVNAQERATTAEAKLAKLDAERIAQQERWTQVTAAEETHARQVEVDRTRRFAGLSDRARNSPALLGVRIAPGALGMLRDAYAATDPAGAASGPTSPATVDSQASLADWAAWSVEVLSWSAECRDRVEAWSGWYSSLRKANP
jgi:hypothetical protein